MNWLVYHIASGNAFFSGIALLVGGVIAAEHTHRSVTRIAVLAVLIGGIAVIASATPIPYCYYALAALVTGYWFCSLYPTSWRRWIAAAVVLVWTVAAAMEIPYRLMPTLEPASARLVAVIGDSVTAGMGNGAETTWPEILSRNHEIEVHDLSQVGARTQTALRRVQREAITSPVVIVEIGGNDLLGSTPPHEFSEHLDLLLAQITEQGRQVVMFELPLPPFSNEYGRVQRRLARKHGVKLVPKWVFLSVLAPREATLDSIHLSQAGHQRMADWAWRIIEPAYP